MPDSTERQPRFFRLKPFDLDLGDVLVQTVAVALGVILGFAVTAWNERNHQHALLRETVANIVDEISSNKDGMAHVTAEHASEAKRLQDLVSKSKSSGHVALADFTKALRPMRINVPLAIAWQISQNNQGLTLLPYDDRYSLAWVYQVQNVYNQRQEQYENSLLSLSESPSGNYYFQVVDMANQLGSVVGIERQLNDLYSQALKRAKTELKT
jgi:hypothetical protein